MKIAAVALALALLLTGVFLARQQHQRRALREGLARAGELMRPDTYAGYAAAADLLKSLVPLDPLQAGSARALALGMLASDYREEARAAEAEQLLVEPERASSVPPAANLAEAALLLPREAGTAMTFASRAPGSPWSGVIQARVALWAGNLPTALELAETALAIDPEFPAALALKGDVLRRRKEYEAARDAYAAALRTSPTHARAAFGMAKLALSDKAPSEQAAAALERLLGDPSTHSNERARSALHLAALRARAGNRPGSLAAIEAAQVSPAARLWLEKAVAEEELTRNGYRVVGGAPAALQSSQDDDPYEPAPAPPRAVESPRLPSVIDTPPPPPLKHSKAQIKGSKKSASHVSRAAKTKKVQAKASAKNASKAIKKKPAKKKARAH